MSNEGKELREEYQTKLLVNNKFIEMNPFVEEFLARVVIGIVCSLKGVDDIKNIEIKKQTKGIDITVNGKEVPLTPFPVMIIESTISGMVSVLKDVGDLRSILIQVEVKTQK